MHVGISFTNANENSILLNTMILQKRKTVQTYQNKSTNSLIILYVSAPLLVYSLLNTRVRKITKWWTQFLWMCVCWLSRKSEFLWVDVHLVLSACVLGLSQQGRWPSRLWQTDVRGRQRCKSQSYDQYERRGEMQIRNGCLEKWLNGRSLSLWSQWFLT